MDDQKRSDLATNVTAADGNVTAVSDILERLRSHTEGNDVITYEITNEAADEIERLRAAGDALAKQVTKPCRCVEAHDGAINETCAPCAAFFDWEEARRG